MPVRIKCLLFDLYGSGVFTFVNISVVGLNLFNFNLSSNNNISKCFY